MLSFLAIFPIPRGQFPVYDNFPFDLEAKNGEKCLGKEPGIVSNQTVQPGITRSSSTLKHNRWSRTSLLWEFRDSTSSVPSTTEAQFHTRWSPDLVPCAPTHPQGSAHKPPCRDFLSFSSFQTSYFLPFRSAQRLLFLHSSVPPIAIYSHSHVPASGAVQVHQLQPLKLQSVHLWACSF